MGRSILGTLCSCFHVPDVQDNSNDSSSNNCICPKCFFQRLKNKHGTMFSQGQMRAVSCPNQQLSSSNSGLSFNNSSDARSRVQPEPIGQSDAQENRKYINPGNKIFIPKEHNAEPSAKISPIHGTAETFPSSDSEDVCPTCLEDYTEENPKIMGKCSHHYHLSCIYEWMERSEKCPICGKKNLLHRRGRTG